MAVVWASTTLLRWLTLDFENDYFMHVSWAAEIARGQLPVRDFVEPGFPLQTLISYWSMRVGGDQLAVEGMVAAALIGLGAACTYAVCRRLGLRRSWALIAAGIAVLVYPRLYAYPKAFAYPAGLLAIAVYAKHPRLRSLLLLATTTAVAFLFRHDHGVWIAMAGGVAVVLVHASDWRRSARAVLTLAAFTALFTLPWLAWVAMSGHAADYGRWVVGQGTDVVTEWRWPDRAFAIDRQAPLVSLVPAPNPTIGIRWSPIATLHDRREREQLYGLLRTDDSYEVTNPGSANVLALLSDPLVEDTRGIDRRSGRVPPGGFTWAAHRLITLIPLLRVRLLPGIVNERNALPWLTWTAFLLPWAMLLYAAVQLFIVTDPSQRRVTIVVMTTALLGIIGYQRIVRGSPDSRIADVSAVSAVLLVYAAAQAFRVRGAARWPARVAAAVLVALTAGGALSYGRVIPRIAGAGVDGPTNLVRRASDVFTLYRQPPLEVFAPDGSRGLPRLARWLHECTTPNQRVAVIGFEPEINVWAERGFAGGLAYFDLGFMSDPRDQQLTITRWQQQDVPFGLLMTSEAAAFTRDYAQIHTWLQSRYTPVRTATFGGDKEVTVLMARNVVPAPTHADTGLPCLVDGRSEP